MPLVRRASRRSLLRDELQWGSNTWDWGRAPGLLVVVTMGEDEQSDELTEEMEAMALWERHMKQAAERWHEGVSHSGEDYRRGLAEGLGVDEEDVPDETVEHWRESVIETDAEEFAGSIAGEGSDWFVNLYEEVTGNEPPDRVKQSAQEVVDAAQQRAGDEASDEELTTAVHEEIKRRMPESA